MKRRRVLGLLGGASLLGSATLGSGAFSSVEAEREAKVRVANDPNAYLGLTYPSNSGDSEPIPSDADYDFDLGSCRGKVVVEVMNNTPEVLSDVTVTFQWKNGTDAIDSFELVQTPFTKSGEKIILDVNEDLGIGNSAEIPIIVNFEEESTSKGESVLQFDVSASDEEDEISIETDYSQEIKIRYDCTPDVCEQTITVPEDATSAENLSTKGGKLKLSADDSEQEVSGEIKPKGNIDISLYASDNDITVSSGIETSGNICIDADADDDDEEKSVKIGGNVVQNGNGDIKINHAVIGGKIKANGNTEIRICDSVVCGGIEINGGGNGDIKLKDSTIEGSSNIPIDCERNKNTTVSGGNCTDDPSSFDEFECEFDCVED